MSSTSGDLKAGHPPAVKAGGMRVVTKHKPPEKQDPDAYDQKYLDQLPEQSNIAAPISAPAVVQKDFSDTTASKETKLAHTKPQPTVQKTHSPSKPKIINQPRK